MPAMALCQSWNDSQPALGRLPLNVNIVLVRFTTIIHSGSYWILILSVNGKSASYVAHQIFIV